MSRGVEVAETMVREGWAFELRREHEASWIARFHPGSPMEERGFLDLGHAPNSDPAFDDAVEKAALYACNFYNLPLAVVPT